MLLSCTQVATVGIKGGYTTRIFLSVDASSSVGGIGLDSREPHQLRRCRDVMRRWRLVIVLASPAVGRTGQGRAGLGGINRIGDDIR